MDASQVPQTTIQRLPLYLRVLLHAHEIDIPVINSLRIAEMAGTNAAQVRKDLSFLGELGTRGIGYDVEDLICHLQRWLGLTERRQVAISGVGRLGSAIRSYAGLSKRGFEVVALFDADPARVEAGPDGVPVRHSREMREALTDADIDIVIIATPPEAAQSVADDAVAAGVKAILNFAPTTLEVPRDVSVRQVDLATEMQILSSHLGSLEGGLPKKGPCPPLEEDGE